MMQTYQFGVYPYQTAAPAAVSPMQTQTNDMISQILPLMTLMLVFSMIMPMFKSMGKAFGGEGK